MSVPKFQKVSPQGEEEGGSVSAVGSSRLIPEVIQIPRENTMNMFSMVQFGGVHFSEVMGQYWD